MALGRPILEESGCRAHCYLSHQRHLGLAERVHTCLVPLCMCAHAHVLLEYVRTRASSFPPSCAVPRAQWGECTHVHMFLCCAVVVGMLLGYCCVCTCGHHICMLMCHGSTCLAMLETIQVVAPLRTCPLSWPRRSQEAALAISLRAGDCGVVPSLGAIDPSSAQSVMATPQAT